MKIFVLGTGPTILSFGKKLRKEITVGVNYIWKYYPADYVITMDKPSRLADWKLKLMLAGNESKFISPLDSQNDLLDCKELFLDWKKYKSNLIQIQLSGYGRGNLKDIDNKEFLCYAGNGGYCAIVYAYHLGATEIVLYGIDFTNHPAITGKVADKEIERILLLRDALKERGVEMYVGSEGSRLFPYIQISK